MKKLLLIALFAIGNLMCSYAQQNDTVLYIENCQDYEYIYICLDKFHTLNIYAEVGCTGFRWYLGGQERWDNPLTIESQSEMMTSVEYHGCNIPERTIWPYFRESRIPNSFSRVIWKRNNDTERLEAIGIDSLEYPFRYEFLWSTGETTSEIEVTEPGTYTCEVIDACGSSTRTFIVRDNVEVELATCDLETNLNMVTWPTTPAQAEYVSQVEVKRDGLVVGTAPYNDGYFLDNIGSDAASRTYTVTAIATDGMLCPLMSHPKETIHMAYLTGINNTIEVNWNAPTGYDLLGYNICEWHESDGSLSVIDYVGASVTSYTCSQSQFDQGYIVVQGVDAGKDGETRLLSNRSMDLVGLGENESTAFKVYPNPAKDRFIVEGSGTMTITNTFGQTFLRREIDGKTTIELPQGMYFVKLGGVTRKVVVE